MQVVDRKALLECACKAGVVLYVRVRARHFILRHGRHVLVHGGIVPDEAAAAIRAAFVIVPDRSPAQDIEAGTRQLVEIGLRALSPGMNDPFTAIANIDRLAAALEVAMSRGEPAAVLRDGDGVVRVLLDRSDPAGLVGAAFDALRQTGRSNPAILIRKADVIGQLAPAVPGDAWAQALARQLVRIGETAQSGGLTSDDLGDANQRIHRAAGALNEPLRNHSPDSQSDTAVSAGRLAPFVGLTSLIRSNHSPSVRLTPTW